MNEKKKEYPDWICSSCGREHGKRGHAGIATWHEGECGICGKIAAVTEPRDFGHLKLGWDGPRVGSEDR